LVGAVLLVGGGALIVVAIAAAAVGTVTRRLATEPPKNFFDIEEAVDFIADRLPEEVTARCSYDEVRQVLYWHLGYLKTKGLAAEGTADVLADRDATDAVVVDDDQATAWVLGRVSEAELDLDDTDVVAIVDTELDYLRAIGALGPAVAAPEEP
jgi:hypothetical protein